MKPKAWTVLGGFDLPIGPNFKVSPEASYASVSTDVPFVFAAVEELE